MVQYGHFWNQWKGGLINAREMQIEFERRWMTLNPQGEVQDKLESDTIFAFINAFAQRYVKTNYIAEDQVQDGSRIQRKTADNFRTLTNIITVNAVTNTTDSWNQNTTAFDIPDDFLLYIRSNSIVSKTYKDATENTANLKTLPNQSVSIDSVDNIVTNAFNKTIIRFPYLVLSEDQLKVIHDTHTIVKQLNLTYLRQPKPINVIGVDDINILSELELPESCHMEIVDGAFNMYVAEYRYRATPMDQTDNTQQ